jgi:lipoprotein-releasing system permease protein
MSRLPFELFLALRYLRPKRTFVSVITLISVIGVMLGVAVLIIVISVMTGFDRQLRDSILSFNAHLRISRQDGVMADFPAVMNIVRSNKNVKAVAPFVLAQVMLKTQPESGKSRVSAPYIRGIDPELEKTVSSLATNIVFGEFDVSKDGILVGSEMARYLQLNVGDRVAIYSPLNLEEMEKHRGKKDEVAILPDEFVVRGIFDVGYYEYNANIIVASMRNAQRLYEIPGKAHGLFVLLHDPYKANAVREELQHSLGTDCDIVTWTSDNSRILTALAVEKNVMFYLLIFIVIVAAFGIMNSLITFVVQKTREIGMLKALGATQSQLLWLFLSQSLVVGVVGVAAGLGLGMLAIEFRNEFLDFMNSMTGLELFPREIYAFSRLPALIIPRDIGLICGSAVVICLLAGLIPALSASRLKPVEALRHE